MGDLPLPVASGAGVLSLHVTRVTSDPVPAKSAPPVRDFALLSVLRETVTAGTFSTDSILNALADAARVLSGADGTAIASRNGRDGVIVCRARSGQIAPGLGARLNSDSGISGECLRSGAIQICGDASTDERVDSEACRSLGIRSVAVVPLRGSRGMFGILEAFSAHPHAFEKEHITSLQALAEIAELACDYERHLPAPAAVTPEVRRPAFSPPPARVDHEQYHGGERSSAKRYWIVGGIAIVLFMMAGAARISWRQTGAEIAASTESHPQPIGTVGLSHDPTRVAAALKPDPTIAARQTNRARTSGLIEKAAEIEPVPETPVILTPSRNPSFSGLSAKSPKPPGTAISESEPPPPIAIAVNDQRGEMPQLASPSTQMPRFAAPISQGVVEPTLIQRVSPIYPTEARVHRMVGSVVLDAEIAEDGFVRKVRIVSGPVSLADAAASAVRQWRYNPALLNGKPVEVQKRITVVFKLP